jgi:hypothetical protein
VSGRYLQIALHQGTKSLPLIDAARAACRKFVPPLIFSACLTLVLVGTSICASVSASPSADEPYSATDATQVEVLGVRTSSRADYSQVVIDVSADVRYKVGHLSNPERLYLDLRQTRINTKLASRRITLEDALVDQIRMGTDQGAVTRIVLDLHTAVRYRISKLGDPARILVELTRDAASPVEPQDTTSPPSNQEMSPTKSTLAPPAYAGRAQAPPAHEDAEKAGLSYAGTAPPQNVLELGLTTGSGYDDNILGNNQQRIGDTYFLFGPSLRLRREGKSLSLALSYQPHFRIYRNASELNTLDHGLAFDSGYRVSSRLSFRARTSALYTNGFSQPSQNEQVLPGVGSPSSLNETLFTPTVRQLMVSSRIDASYQATPHDTVGLFLSQATLGFEQQISNAGSLQNTLERGVGLLYRHRLSPHTRVGIDYLLQDIQFGPDSRTLVQSAFFSYAQQFSRGLSLSVFGGPQYSRLEEGFSLPLDPSTLQAPGFSTQWNWATGGELTMRSDKTVFQFTAQHQISNGGGLLGAVVSSSIGANVRHRLAGRWEAIGTAGYANNSSLGSTFFQGGYRSLTVGTGLQCSMTEKLALGVRYDFIRQTGTGQSPSFANFDRNLWSVQLSYRFHQIALGQ